MNKRKLKAYYAHCMAIYNTPQEERDIRLLKSLGFDVLNPNQKKHQEGCKRVRDKMMYFISLAMECDLIAFRANPDGSIPSGVAAEIVGAGVPIIELPSCMKRRMLSLEETVKWLEESGQR